MMVFLKNPFWYVLANNLQKYHFFFTKRHYFQEKSSKKAFFPPLVPFPMTNEGHPSLLIWLLWE